MFDGVHLGHQRVLNQTISEARKAGAVSAAITFDQHPNTVVAPDRAPLLIYRLAHRLRVIEGLGMDSALLIHFDRAFSQQPAEEFITRLVKDFGKLHAICIGSGFTFGHKRSGDVALLRRLGERYAFSVHAMPAVVCRGKIVSSTRIREAIRTGNFESAGEMLGRPFEISGRVLRGEQLGRTLGFPTANLEAAGLALPPNGVYAGTATVKGVAYKAVANLGYRPTVSSDQLGLRVEVHLLGFAGDLYGQELEFAFRQRLRGEVKFASLADLQAQIRKDVLTAESLEKCQHE